MIDALGTYLFRHVWRRQLGRIFSTSHPYISVLLSYPFISGGFGKLPPLSLDALLGITLTYNTVVFAFTVAAIALVIAIPNENFLQFVARSGSNAYRDIAFVFSWTGLVHWLAFFQTVVSLVVLGKDSIINGYENGASIRTWYFTLVTLQIYCMLQFLVTIIATFEISDLYGMWLRRPKSLTSQAGKDG